jgi:hypothetical protein
VSEEAHSPDLDGTFEADGRVTLFGFDSTPAHTRLRPRSKAWRVSGVIRIVAITVVVAPVVTVIPPHAPWLIGVLGGGTYLARRRWSWRFTLEALEGRCPKCGAALQVRPGRLRDPHGLSCDSCHNDVELRVPAEALEAHSGATE